MLTPITLTPITKSPAVRLMPGERTKFFLQLTLLMMGVVVMLGELAYGQPPVRTEEPHTNGEAVNSIEETTTADTAVSQPTRRESPRDESEAEVGTTQENTQQSALDGKERSVLGVFVEPSRNEQQGLPVVEVMQDGPAHNAGIRSGDHLLSLNNREVAGPRQLAELVGSLRPGQAVTLEILRDGTLERVEATLMSAEKVQQIYESKSRDRGEAGEASDQHGGWLGVMLRQQESVLPDESGDASGSEGGVGIAHVYPGSPAAESGFRDGDQIVAIAGERIETVQQAVEAINRHEAGETVTFQFVRPGDTDPATVEVTLASRQDFMPARRQSSDAGNAWRDPIITLPEHALRLEHDRRLAEHDQRIEGLVLQLLREVRELQRDVDALIADRDSRQAENQPPTRQSTSNSSR